MAKVQSNLLIAGVVGLGIIAYLISSRSSGFSPIPTTKIQEEITSDIQYKGSVIETLKGINQQIKGAQISALKDEIKYTQGEISEAQQFLNTLPPWSGVLSRSISKALEFGGKGIKPFLNLPSALGNQARAFYAYQETQPQRNFALDFINKQEERIDFLNKEIEEVMSV